MTDAQTLSNELNSAGNLPAGFGPVLDAVPRARFIPAEVWVKEKGEYRPLDRNAEPDLWTRAVYTNRSIVTQFDDGRTEWPVVGDRPTSSASMPSVVLAMLEALDLEPGQAVMEIGTGTGFNAALLAELVGQDGRVTTIEVDPRLAEQAEHAFAALDDSDVRIVTADGAVGDPQSAPFDRVIATAAVQAGRIPYAWVEQTRPGGIIVVPVRTDLASGPLVRFVVGDDGTATGRVLPMGVGFMEVRSQRTPRADVDDNIGWDTIGEHMAVTDLDPRRLLDDPAARWALAVAMPSCRYDMDESTTNRPFDVWWLRDPLTGSWASIAPDRHKSDTYRVRQSGPRRLWDEAQFAFGWWRAQGSPGLSSWNWTITRDRQSITLGNDRITHH